MGFVFSNFSADPPLGVAQGLIGRDLAQIDRAVAVHVDLADIGAQAAVFQQLHQMQRRGHMDGRKNGGAGGRAAEQMLRERGICAVRILQILIFRFLGEGVGVEPLEKLHVHAQPAEGKLRRVDVQIRHAGQNEAVAAVSQRQRRKAARQRRKHAAHQPVLHDKKAVFRDLDAVHRPARTNLPLQDKAVHAPPLLLVCFLPFGMPELCIMPKDSPNIIAHIRHFSHFIYL